MHRNWQSTSGIPGILEDSVFIVREWRVKKNHLPRREGDYTMIVPKEFVVSKVTHAFLGYGHTNSRHLAYDLNLHQNS